MRKTKLKTYRVTQETIEGVKKLAEEWEKETGRNNAADEGAKVNLNEGRDLRRVDSKAYTVGRQRGEK